MASADEQPDEVDSDGASIRESLDSDVYEGGLWDEHPLYRELSATITDFMEGETHKSALLHKTAIRMVRDYNLARPEQDTVGWEDCLWRFDPRLGIYKRDGEDFVRAQTQRLLGGILTGGDKSQVVEMARDYSMKPSAWFQSPPEHLVVENGILNVLTGNLMPHSPNEPHNIRIGVEWPENPDEASYERFDEFIRSVVAEKDVDTIYRAIAHCLYKDYPSSKALMLVGDGSNGKGTLLAAIRRFLNPGTNMTNNPDIHKNVSSMSLQKISQGKWYSAELNNALANIDDDMGSEAVKQSQEFKRATGGKDTMDAQRKYGQIFEFVNHATLMFAVNEVPMTEDDSDAFWRRWIYLNFPNTFKSSDEDFVEQETLLQEVCAPAQLSGLLVRCVKELQRWQETGTFYPDIPSPEAVREEMKKASDSVYAFVSDCIEVVDDPEDDDFITKSDLREAYDRYAKEENLPRIIPSVFGKRVQSLEDYPIESSETRMTDTTGRDPVYRPIRFTPRGYQVLDGALSEGISQFDDEESETDDEESETDDEESETDEETDEEQLEQHDDEQGNQDGPTDVEGPTLAAAKAVTLVRKAEGDECTYSELFVALSEDGISASHAAAGIEKAITRGDLIEDGSILRA